jgi:hypothetical protein
VNNLTLVKVIVDIQYVLKARNTYVRVYVRSAVRAGMCAYVRG